MVCHYFDDDADHTLPPLSLSLQLQIKDRVYKNRIRVKDFFADYDKLRCGCVTEAQVRDTCDGVTNYLPHLQPTLFFLLPILGEGCGMPN